MITKEDAIEVLRNLETSGILADDIEDSLSEICTCLNYLDKGLDIFGGDNEEVSKLFTAKMNPYNSSAPYNTDELKAEYDKWIVEVDAIAEKYKIKG